LDRQTGVPQIVSGPGGDSTCSGERITDGKYLPSIFQEKEARTVAKKKAKKKGK
jgi:hypothetical protein